MRKMGFFKRFLLSVSTVMMAVCMCVVPVKANESADAAALAQYQALIASPQYQALLVAMQQQQQTAAQYQQQILENQQNALLLQYQAACKAQNYLYEQQIKALPRVFMLQQIQNMQNQQFQSMVKTQGFDYQSMLLEDHQKYQDAALKAFLGYNGF